MGSGSKSDLEFWDMDFNVDDFGRKESGAPTAERKEEWGAGMQLMAAVDHYGVTDIEWDPSGRFVATSVSVWRHSVRTLLVIHRKKNCSIVNRWKTDSRYGTSADRSSNASW